ncbi:conserved Plasmodium protein, unknown function [Plasmodium relictum]|uniref:Uncharacterized protein n=1 Tax=Plasmodium relictum TaxID=85471 RepID=A0A1J1H5F8_PLARL|nr:conserved Plasmodium protein, unknown function [Plasmodium relictum]CRH00142.1 conserved Plasmodium protein, unknown function [Plasmodium relictum]
MRSCYSHKGTSPGKHIGKCVSYDSIEKTDMNSGDNGTYSYCTICGIVHKDPHKQALYPLREDQYRCN